MVTFEETIFLISFLGFVVLFIYKLWYIINEVSLPKKERQQKNDLSKAFITYIVGSLCYGFIFVTLLISVDNVLMATLFNFARPMFILMTLFIIIELFFYWQHQAINATRQRYNPADRL